MFIIRANEVHLFLFPSFTSAKDFSILVIFYRSVDLLETEKQDVEITLLSRKVLFSFTGFCSPILFFFFSFSKNPPNLKVKGWQTKTKLI